MRSYRFVSGDPLESHTVLPQNSRSADGHTVGLAAQQDTRMSLLEEVTGLQREWTDRFVQVDGSIPELKRFAGLTGQVKTVNMSGHALVEFTGSEDIGWYDIHPQFLTVVEVDVPTESTDDTQAAVEDAPAPAQETTAPAAEAPPADTSNLSPLELARLQDSGGAASKSKSKAKSRSRTRAKGTPRPSRAERKRRREETRVRQRSSSKSASAKQAKKIAIWVVIFCFFFFFCVCTAILSSV